MKILNEADFTIDSIGWPRLTFNENEKTKEVWINIRCVNQIIYDFEENSILICLNTTEVYKLICPKNFTDIKNRVEQYFIFKS